MRAWFEQKQRKPELSIVIVFHNMRREAVRTLYSLTDHYQRGIEALSYEVIVLDNGSSESLDEDFVKSRGENFRYIYFDTQSPSPCQALNYGAQIARGKWLTLCIDGARILSPGIVYYSMLATKIHPQPFIYTLSMHIGRKVQNLLAEENYSQRDEDELLSAVDWMSDGYRLFDISTVALSSKEGYFSKLTETNCLTISRSSFKELGGFDERFQGNGGGLANLDFFNRVNEKRGICPVMLLGEATFHQFHGGVATNAPLKQHPFQKMAQEYYMIKGKPYIPYERKPVYLGTTHPECYSLFTPPKEEWKESK